MHGSASLALLVIEWVFESGCIVARALRVQNCERNEKRSQRDADDDLNLAILAHSPLPFAFVHCLQASPTMSDFLHIGSLMLKPKKYRGMMSVPMPIHPQKTLPHDTSY